MAFVNPAVATAAGVLGPNRLRHAPNVEHDSCLSDEEGFLSMRIVCIFIGYQGSRFSV